MAILNTGETMKNRFVAVMAFLFACAATCMFLVTAGYLYLDRRMQKTGQNTSGIPYEFSLPENRSILLEIGASRTALFLDFEGETLYVADYKTDEAILSWPFGGAFDYTLRADLDLLSFLVDTVGGIPLCVGGETLRYTGSQVTEMLTEGIVPDPEPGNTVKEALIRKIAQEGLQRKEMQKMIELSETELSVMDCALWEEYLPALFANAVFIE